MHNPASLRMFHNVFIKDRDFLFFGGQDGKRILPGHGNSRPSLDLGEWRAYFPESLFPQRRA